MKFNKKAKIVATIGPSIQDFNILKQIYKVGADIFRINFSHGTHEEHAKSIKNIRSLEREFQRPVTILADLQGPKYRVGYFKNNKVKVEKGHKFIFDMNPTPGDENRCNLPHKIVFDSIKKGNEILADDGKLKFIVIKVNTQEIITEVMISGDISNCKGVNLPGLLAHINPITKKDKCDLDFILTQEVDWIALSFVQNDKDIIELRKLANKKINIIAKIEKPQAITNINQIIKESDAIMIARGDLGVEVPLEQVPSIQKQIIKLARKSGIPVIVATQMLESMINNPRPTRAETSDIATAIYDGVDAVMLSAETSVGQYAVESVSIMEKVISEVEKDTFYSQLLHANKLQQSDNVSNAITFAASQVADTLSAKVIVIYTTTGMTCLLTARQRPNVPIICISPDIETARRMNLLWGVYSCVCERMNNFDDMINKAKNIVFESKFVDKGELFILTLGLPFPKTNTTNILKVIQM